MAHRCPDCNKFVGTEPGDLEVDSLEVEGEEVTTSIRAVLNCAECGSELAEWQVDATVDLPAGAIDHLREHQLNKDEESTLTAQWENDPEITEDYKARKRFYQITGTVLLSCSCGNEDVGSVEIFEEAAGSEFESTV